MIVVVKVGTSSLIRAEQQTLNLSNLARICETVKTLRQAGHDVIIVSSGAVGAGCQRLGIRTRPSGNLAQKQALAAVGQLHLMRYYSDMFSSLDLVCSQVLLTLDNLASRSTYLNARSTFAELLALGTIPVVNENDTVAVEQLRFGDNDTLSAQVAALVGADLLFLLTDVDCLYTANPNNDPDAQPIQEVADISKLAVDTSTSGTQWGTGGMSTKLTAARIATAAGTRMVICNCQEPERLAAFVLQDRHVGTVFHPLPGGARGRKRWILAVPLMGRLLLDRGAVAAVGAKKKSLFPAGILQVDGEFSAQEGVRLCDEAGQEFARALVNYASAEIDCMKGKQSEEWRSVLGYVGSEEVAHRDNITVLAALDHESDSDDLPERNVVDS